MHQSISKKIFIYLIIFLILGTFNNKRIFEFIYPKINNFEIIGLIGKEKKELKQDLFFLNQLNLFSLENSKIIEIINSKKFIESYTIFKNYPTNLIINIKKTEFLAYTKKNNLNYYIGSNGNLIKTHTNKVDLPFVFGDLEINEFLKLKKIIDKSGFDYNDIKNLYYYKSKRWDIETKNNLIIKLPKKKLDNTFKILLKIYNNKEFSNLKLLDLRLENQVIFNG